jgi:hypothetical protein
MNLARTKITCWRPMGMRWFRLSEQDVKTTKSATNEPETGPAMPDQVRLFDDILEELNPDMPVEDMEQVLNLIKSLQAKQAVPPQMVPGEPFGLEEGEEPYMTHSEGLPYRRGPRARQPLSPKEKSEMEMERVPIDPTQPVRRRPVPLEDPRQEPIETRWRKSLPPKELPKTPWEKIKGLVPWGKGKRQALYSPGKDLSNDPLEKSPDIVDQALSDEPKAPVVPSTWPRPGKIKPKKRRLVKRRPGPDLAEGPKRPTDGTGWPRPSGTGQ